MVRKFRSIRQRDSRRRVILKLAPCSVPFFVISEVVIRGACFFTQTPSSSCTVACVRLSVQAIQRGSVRVCIYYITLLVSFVQASATQQNAKLNLNLNLNSLLNSNSVRCRRASSEPAGGGEARSAVGHCGGAAVLCHPECRRAAGRADGGGLA
jgi:hypothetical protein